MASLMDVPGLGGFLQAGQLGQQETMGQLSQLGALQGMLAQAQKAQAQRAALMKEQQLRGALAELGPDATPEQFVQAVRPFASADDLLKITQGSIDKKASAEQTAASRKDALEARLYEIETRSKDRNATLQQQAVLAKMADATRRELAQMGIDLRRESMANRPQQPLEAVIGADGKPVMLPRDQAVGKAPYRAGQQPEKALPSSLTNKYLENIQNLRKAENAEKLLEGGNVGGAVGDTQATGNKGLLTNLGVIGDKVLNFYDPKGVDTRAMIGDLGSMVIHDRSGAAVTAAEFPRLRPFIPLSSDAPEVARKKVKRFVQEYKAEVEAQKEFFSASGYKVPELKGSPDAPKIPEFSTEEDALKAGVKGKVKIGGRNATIE